MASTALESSFTITIGIIWRCLALIVLGCSVFKWKQLRDFVLLLASVREQENFLIRTRVSFAVRVGGILLYSADSTLQHMPLRKNIT
jgi:hypothetical protein